MAVAAAGAAALAPGARAAEAASAAASATPQTRARAHRLRRTQPSRLRLDPEPADVTETGATGNRMGRIFGILLIVVAIWIGMQIYLEGTRHAFGGAFDSSIARAEAPRNVRTTPQRAGDAVRGSLADEAEKRERLMPE